MNGELAEDWESIYCYVYQDIYEFCSYCVNYFFGYDDDVEWDEKSKMFSDLGVIIKADLRMEKS